MTGFIPGRFQGAVAIVTGGGSGIGAAVASRLGAEGAAAIIVADLDPSGARGVAERVANGTAALLDVTDPDAVNACFDGVAAEHGGLDLVVNTAGLDDPAAAEEMSRAMREGEPADVLRGLSDDRWRRIMAVNLDGTFHVLRAAARIMVPARRGTIVTVGSSSAFAATPGLAHYVAAKAGAHALAQSAAKELARFGVRLNVVAPGPVDTPMAGRKPAELRAQIRATAAGYATAEQIADNILYLASPGSSNVVGQILLSSGGRPAG
ncbi:3-oxoacyl-[acyl-carrier protein] reductase [Actinocorallia herbida]|uniref:3-oxoacyl-[acyl-carrier protein] reductase n=1 Tax=Actinocorallia herbida TaxID=58109 RepID=A0A3N1D1T3_9ACTN|nr:SDR family NAD(P)-dependent oxidoreductase [Actinocorallia herbida]ROO87493.1 3-oxoacyl-[acyl-carrier protein] reductase [Actinocorallia herbida]